MNQGQELTEEQAYLAGENDPGHSFDGSNYRSDIQLHSGGFLRSERTKQELEKVLQELRREITDMLDRCGIYYRMTARVKSSISVDKKLSAKQEDGAWIYSDNHHLQDLFGFRILIYFVEDMPILKRLFAEHYSMDGEWTDQKQKRKEEEFSAISVNGVFWIEHISENLAEQLTRILEGQLIDQTFEIQLRTVSFDAWHEIDHDFTYKFTNMWRQQGEYLHRFHSILATLELCDDTMVTTLENLAYDIYARRRHPGRYYEDGEELIFDDSKRSTLCDWDRLIRAHFRMRILHDENAETSDQELLPDLVNLFEQEDIAEQKDSYLFVKYVLRFRKETLIRLFYHPVETLKQAGGIITEQKEKDGAGNTKGTLRNMEDHPVPGDGSKDPDRSGGQIWRQYEFRPRIPITVNTIVIMILLYKEARENNLTKNQRSVLAKDSIRRLVCADKYTKAGFYGQDLIMQERGILFPFLIEEPLSVGWNTVINNDLTLLAALQPEQWVDKLLGCILEDIRVLWSKITDQPPTTEEVLQRIRAEHIYISEVGNGAAGRVMICWDTEAEEQGNKDSHEGHEKVLRRDSGKKTERLRYYIEYPGMVFRENTWRQMIEYEYTPKDLKQVIGQKAMSSHLQIRMKTCIQIMNRTEDQKQIPAITEPYIYRVMRTMSKGTIYPAKPYIGQNSKHKDETHGTDVVDILRLPMATVTYGNDHGEQEEVTDHLWISRYFQGAYMHITPIHPMILILFDSEEDLYEMEPAIAILENRIAYAAYLYTGIIRNTDRMPGEELDRMIQDDISLEPYGITESGLYIFGIEPGKERHHFQYALPYQLIRHISYTMEGKGKDQEPETINGMDALLYLLEREIRRYNMIIHHPGIDHMVEVMETLLTTERTGK